MPVLQVVVPLLIALALAIPTGRYLYRIFGGGPAPGDRLFLPLERLIYRLIGLKNPDESMTWKGYAAALLAANALMLLLVYGILRVQGALPWNPRAVAGLEPTLAFNTAVSFMTNTNLQHYRGETDLSYFAQMAAIQFPMFTSAATGFAVAVAFVRGITGGPPGNYWSDMTRFIVRLLLPAALLLALFLVWQGSPQTLSPGVQAITLDGARQGIAVGPVASLESIKHIGTNGGGFFATNAAHPFENPTPLTNVIYVLCMLWIPTGFIFMFGQFAKNRRLSWVFFSAAAVVFLALLGNALYFESTGLPVIHRLGLAGPWLEGKEVRFGAAQTALFATTTTAATTGSVNAMFASFTPMGLLTPLLLMMLNSIFGGVGAGFMNLTGMAMIAVFLVGLMVGRTPEFLRRKLDTREIVLLAIVILIHPLLILGPSALALVSPTGVAGVWHAGFRGLEQLLYEYTSAAANNGSEVGGFAVNNWFWNISTGLVMFFGRYPSMIALLAISSFLAAKKPVPEGPATLHIDTPLFVVVLVGVVLIVGALTFFPALALGPIAEHLTLR